MKKIFIILSIILSTKEINACTTFFINHKGQMVFGRNYDWMADAGMVCSNHKGLAKTSLKTADGSTISWVSLYGSISFNQYGKEFPTGGMNEKGLVVELMWLDGTVYPSPDERPSIGVLQWIQYQLDNCANIEEVIKTDKKLRINSKGTPLHYLIADANGNAATIEFLEGKMVVHKGKDLPFPVLTNDTYESSVASRQNGTANGNNSLERFAGAGNMVKQYQTNTEGKGIVEHAFDILGKVSQGGYTKWSIVYDISNKSISFKTHDFPEIKNITFSSIDFSCNASSKAMDMNVKAGGDIDKRLTDFSADLNRRMVEKALEQSQSRIRPAKEEKEASIAYPARVSCN